MLETISSALKELGEFRKTHPFVGYIIILALLISIVFGILVKSEGNWLPLVIGVVIFIFFLFVLLIFSNAAKEESKGVKYLLSLALLTFVTLMFMIWVVLLTLAVVGKVCILDIGECEKRVAYKVDGTIMPIYSMVEYDRASNPFEHYRSSCRGRSSNTTTACIKEGFVATSGVVQGLWIKNDNGSTSTPVVSAGNSHCYTVNWNAASGGRTAIGECRYHGHIRFTLVVSGKREYEETGSEMIVLSEPTSLHSDLKFKYDKGVPTGEIIETTWKYNFTVTRIPEYFGLVKGWKSNVSEAIPKSPCVDSGVSDQGTVTLKIDPVRCKEIT